MQQLALTANIFPLLARIGIVVIGGVVGYHVAHGARFELVLFVVIAASGFLLAHPERGLYIVLLHLNSDELRVATRLPDSEPLAHLVDSAQAFVPAIERALEEESPRAQAVRMQEAQKHSWTARFARIDALIEKTFAAKDQSGSTLETRAFCA